MQRTDGWVLLAMPLLHSRTSASFAISKWIIDLFTFAYTLDDECNEDVRRQFLQNSNALGIQRVKKLYDP